MSTRFLRYQFEQYKIRWQKGHIFALCLLIFLVSSGVDAASVTRGPYLQVGTEDAITIRWRTDSSTDSMVRYGSQANNLDQHMTVSGSRSEHEVRLSGLTPETQYYYSIGSSSETIASGHSYRFNTSPTIGNSRATRIWVIGDAGTANANQAAVYNAYLNYPGADNTDLWIMLGDNAYNNGTDSEYQTAVFDMYPELLRRTPVWSTLGNHDGYSADSASESGPYYDIFTLPRNGEAGGLASGTEAYYSFDYGDIHFICLDSYHTSRAVNGAMMTWMENDIAATKQAWIIAFWHHPPYTKGSHDSDTEGDLIDMRENALPILESYGVDLVLSGHSHSYERSYLIDGHYGHSSTFSSSNIIDGGDGNENGNGAYQKASHTGNAGTVYTVAGASGKISGVGQHTAMFASRNELGSVIIDVSGNRIDAKYLRSDGVVTDQYTVIKGPDTTPPVINTVDAVSSEQVRVNFSETVDVSSAQNVGNYEVNELALVSAVANGNTATLNTSAMELNTVYTLRVNNVEDTNGNIIASNSQANFEYVNLVTQSFQQGVSPDSGYDGMSDTYVASGNPDASNGFALEILADASDGDNGELASLLKWDLSQIPVGSSVTSAQIELQFFNASDGGTYELYVMQRSWGEDTATWNSIDPHGSRGTLVGSFQSSTTGLHAIELNAAGLTLLESWINDEGNDGVIVMSAGSTDGIDIRSSEYTSSAERPKLTLTYKSSVSAPEPPVLVQAEDYSQYSDTTEGNSGGQYRTENVDIEVCTDAEGGFNVGWTISGEWLEYQVNLPAGTYTVVTRVASEPGGSSYTLLMDGVSVASDTVGATGGWQSWESHSLGSVNVTGGVHTVRVNVSGGDFNLNWIQFDRVN